MSYGSDIWVNPKYVNYNNSQWSGNFTSNVIPCGLPEPVNNVSAASSYIKGLTKGGGKKIKNVNKIYMKKSNSKIPKNSYYLTKKRLLKNKKLNKKHNKSKNSRKHKNSYTKKLRGGYSQFMNNVPNTPTYSLGGFPNTNYPSSLANPPPYNVLSNCTNCVDNYNHYTNYGFPSKGSY